MGGVRGERGGGGWGGGGGGGGGVGGGGRGGGGVGGGGGNKGTEHQVGMPERQEFSACHLFRQSSEGGSIGRSPGAKDHTNTSTTPTNTKRKKRLDTVTWGSQKPATSGHGGNFKPHVAPTRPSVCAVSKRPLGVEDLVGERGRGGQAAWIQGSGSNRRRVHRDHRDSEKNF